MTVKNVEKKEQNLVELTVVVDAETFGAALEQAYRKNIGRMNVPGFRKGKAPRKIVESMFGSGVFYQDAVNATWPDAYDDAVKQEGLETVERPDVEVESIGAEGYTFIARVHVYPEIEIGQYKGISAYAPPVEATDDEINAEVERMRERNASLVTVERAAKMGDTVILDYEGFLDGVPFEGGKGERHTLELGSNSFIPGFEEKLAGFRTGDEPDVNVSFPEDYHAGHLAGKPVVFKCRIHEVKEKQLPEADDEFAKDISEFDTLQAYKDSVRERILHAKEHDSSNAFESALLEQIVPTVKGDIPDAIIHRHLDDIINDFSYRLQRQGLNIDTYMKATGMDAAALTQQFRPQAEFNAKCSLLFDKIAKLENLTVDGAELDEEYKRLAELYRMEEAEVRSSVPEKSLRRDLLALKASKLITQSAVKLDTPPEPKEEPQNPAKKNAAKKPKASTKNEESADSEATPKTPKKAPAKKKTPAKNKDEEEKA